MQIPFVQGRVDGSIKYAIHEQFPLVTVSALSLRRAYGNNVYKHTVLADLVQPMLTSEKKIPVVKQNGVCIYQCEHEYMLIVNCT